MGWLDAVLVGFGRVCISDCLCSVTKLYKILFPIFQVAIEMLCLDNEVLGFRILNEIAANLSIELCRKRAIELKANDHREGELKLGPWN